MLGRMLTAVLNRRRGRMKRDPAATVILSSRPTVSVTASATPPTGWIPDPPTERGLYWFYGWRGGPEWRARGIAPELFPVRCLVTGECRYISDGSIPFPTAAHGLWQPLIPPVLPDTELALIQEQR